MRTKNLALWVFLALLLGACGGEGETDKDKAVCGNGVVEKGEECDVDDEGCQGCKVQPGFVCDDEGCHRVEICDNDEDDDENGLVDCEDPYCDTDPACVTGCSLQSECTTTGRVVEICVEGICRTAVSFDDGGDVLIGEVGIMNQFDPRRTNVKNIKSLSIVYFHPTIPGSEEPLTCDYLAGLARSASLELDAFNVMRRFYRDFSGDQDTQLLRDSGVPATTEVPWVTLIRFYEGTRETQSGLPMGRMLAFSCVESLQVAPGSTWDASRQVVVQVEPNCRDDEDCAEGWECVKSGGFCAYRQCEPSCGQGYTCRELPNGQPACLKKCHDSLPCDGGFRCDTTPGWEPACFEL